jgi:hypothetical protein
MAAVPMHAPIPLRTATPAIRHSLGFVDVPTRLRHARGVVG